MGGKVIKCPYPLNVTNKIRTIIAVIEHVQINKYQRLMTLPPLASPAVGELPEPGVASRVPVDAQQSCTPVTWRCGRPASDTLALKCRPRSPHGIRRVCRESALRLGCGNSRVGVGGTTTQRGQRAGQSSAAGCWHVAFAFSDDL
jgi:hypothetical protein